MNKKLKIALIIGVPLTLVGAYIIFKKPSFDILDIDWDNKKGVAKLGMKPLNFGVGQGGFIESKGYVLNALPKGETVTLRVTKDGRPVQETTIDFEGKLKY